MRMVKRDSKERSVSRSGGSNEEEDDADSNGSSGAGGGGGGGSSADSSASTSSSTSAKPPSMSPPPPPPPMPKNLFQPSDSRRIPNGTSEPKRRGQEVFSSASLPRKMSNSGLFGNLMNSGEGCGGSSSGADSGVFGSRNTLHGGSMGNGLQQRANFKLGDYYGRKPNGVQRPSSALSAHERLFGSSRESSMSPPTSPASSGSAMQSPVFKSDTARQIAQEVGKVGGGGRRAKKQRSHTIGGGDGNPAVIEAMKAHQARMAARARDDLDMERALADGEASKAAPDVVRSTIDAKEPEDAIDTLFGAPKKISIPERYVPDSDADVTPEERQIRLKKADSIRKMLADTAGPLAGKICYTIL